MTVTPPLLAETPERRALDDALARLRLEGAIFLRAEYSEGWAFESPDGPTSAALLHPGAERVILFHVVASGRCWIRIGDGDRHWADPGDVIVIPYGDQHYMGGESPAEVVSITSILEPPPWEQMPVIRHGAGGELTNIVCGYLACDDPLFDPGLRALPPVFVVHPDEAAVSWVRSSIDYALAATSATPSGTLTVSPRIPELLLVEMLRLHLATAPAAEQGWLAALRDPILAPALALLHAQPERKWTVAELAADVAVSRSLLDERFRKGLGRSPIRYLSDWRMHVAKELLATTDLGVVGVARRVGYDSEEAFSRAFKRSHGRSPTNWRAERP